MWYHLMDMVNAIAKILKRRISKRPLEDYKQEALIRVGREQFKKLIERGTDIPVVLL